MYVIALIVYVAQDVFVSHANVADFAVHSHVYVAQYVIAPHAGAVAYVDHSHADAALYVIAILVHVALKLQLLVILLLCVVLQYVGHHVDHLAE